MKNRCCAMWVATAARRATTAHAASGSLVRAGTLGGWRAHVIVRSSGGGGALGGGWGSRGFAAKARKGNPKGKGKARMKGTAKGKEKTSTPDPEEFVNEGFIKKRYAFAFKVMTLSLSAAAGWHVLPYAYQSSVPVALKLASSKDVFMQRSGVARLRMMADNMDMQIVESATVHVLADLLAKDNCALLADEPKMALQIVEIIGLTADTIIADTTDDMMLRDMLADGAEAALLQARTVVAAATEPDPRGAHGVTVMALREAIATTIAKLHPAK